MKRSENEYSFDGTGGIKVLYHLDNGKAYELLTLMVINNKRTNYLRT